MRGLTVSKNVYSRTLLSLSFIVILDSINNHCTGDKTHKNLRLSIA